MSYNVHFVIEDVKRNFVYHERDITFATRMDAEDYIEDFAGFVTVANDNAIQSGDENKTVVEYGRKRLTMTITEAD